MHLDYQSPYLTLVSYSFFLLKTNIHILGYIKYILINGDSLLLKYFFSKLLYQTFTSFIIRKHMGSQAHIKSVC